jgi:ankyrin repeat protein
MKCGPISNNVLHYACQGGHLDVVKYLADAHHSDLLCEGSSLLYVAQKGSNSYPHSKPLCGGMPLHWAAAHGQLEVVEFITKGLNCDPNVETQNGETPLHWAAANGQLEVVQFLTRSLKCDPNSKDQHGETPLHWAATNGQLPVVKYLILTVGCSELARDIEHNTPLHLAVLNEQLEVLKFFIEDLNCNPNIRGQSDMTPLQLSLSKNSFHVSKFLIGLPHCDVEVRVPTNSLSPLFLAVRTQNLELIMYLCQTRRLDPNFHPELLKAVNDRVLFNFLINYVDPLNHAAAQGDMETVKRYVGVLGWDPNRLDKESNNAFLIAALHGQLEVMKYLAIQTDPCSRGQLERTPLHFASVGGHLDVVKYLLNAYRASLCPGEPQNSLLAADNAKCITQPLTSVVDGDSNTPLHLASLHGHLSVVEFLIEGEKCDPSSKGYQGSTPLHCASKGGHLVIVQYLIDEHHCDPMCTDEKRNTPLHSAAANGQLDVISYFTALLGCSALVKNSHNNTPLHVAVFKGNLQVVKFLIEKLKCDPNARGESDMTPLHLSLVRKHYDIAKYLIGLSDCNVLAKQRKIFHFAVKTQNVDLVSYLCNTCRLDPYLQPEKGKLLELASPAMLEFFKHYVDPLRYAAVYGDLERVKYYIENENWDPKELDRYGNNLLHNAAQHGQLEVVKYLTGLNKDPIHQSVKVLCDPVVKNKYGLTALDIATQSGHDRVVSYLLRITSYKPILEQDVLSPPLNIFVVGNTGSGKSTSVKALCTEKSYLGKILRVKDVTPLTAGIVPTTLHSRMFGEANIYDFAGHEQYYASHEMILGQAIQPLVLLAVKVSLSEEEIQRQILYWLTVLSSGSTADASKTTHVLIVGSHADKINSEKKEDVQKLVSSLISRYCSLKYHGFIQCDCRYPVSDGFKTLRKKLSSICTSIRLFLAQDNDESNRLCAALNYHLQNVKPDRITITMHELQESITKSTQLQSSIALAFDRSLLLETCRELSSSGHYLLLPHDEDEQESVLILDKHTILSRVHACLKAKESLTNKIGMLEEKQLKRILSDLLADVMEPDLAVKYLLFAQFCTEVNTRQLVSVSKNAIGVDHIYFFPNLVSASRPPSLLPPKDGQHFSSFYTWGLKCADSHQFFTPRFLHTLFVQLTKCEYEDTKAKFLIWKNGILLVHSDGTRSIVEVTDQTTRVYLAMQCVKDCELLLVKQRSNLISLIWIRFVLA